MGPSSGLDWFMHNLLDLEAEGGEERALTGAFEGPFFSNGAFGCVMRIGIGDEFRNSGLVSSS